MKSPQLEVAGLLTMALWAAPTGLTQSTDDLWDISQGVTVTDHAPLLGSPFQFDVYAMFGATLAGGTEPGSVIFADGNPPDTLQWVEWRTAVPVTLDTIVVHAGGEDASWDYAREYERVTVRTKSAGSASFDVELFSSYRRFPRRWDLTITNLPLVTAQEFRAEFIPYPTMSSGWPFGLRNGCRVVELDAFGSAGAPTQPAPKVGVAMHAGVTLEGTPGRTYRIEYATTVENPDWVALTNLVLPSTPYTLMDPTPASAPKRYYRAVEVALP